MILLEGTDASAIFARLKKATYDEGIKGLSYSK
jgi:hypothetical protein